MAGMHRIRQELTSMVSHRLNGGDEGRVNITTGGSESILPK